MTDIFIRYGIMWKRWIKHDYLLFFIVQEEHEIKYNDQAILKEKSKQIQKIFFSQRIIKSYNSVSQEVFGYWEEQNSKEEIRKFISKKKIDYS